MQTASKEVTSVNELSKYFCWFDDNFSNLIKNVIQEYWQISPHIRLFSLEKNSKNFISGNDYFVSQADIQKVQCSLRLSETSCEMFLTLGLGENENKYFDFSQLTELEANIISKFNNKIFTKIKDYFISKKEIKNLLENEEEIDYFASCINFGFILQDEDAKFETGKLFLSIPEKLLKLPELEQKEGVIDTTKFKKAKTPVDIYIGKTRLTLCDINALETEDIVVLEQSDIKKMAVIKPANFEFNVNPDPRLFIKDDNFNDNDDMQEDIKVGPKDIWDDVQVDVCAKFPKVKMSLGELREMTEGVVMELDSIYGNEVVLEVENKNVAKGELVIVGYKYGVKITEIISQTEEDNKQEVAPEKSTDDDEDFDVDDFDIKE